jgi:ABC-type polysaccharide/polyol phosphate export permease
LLLSCRSLAVQLLFNGTLRRYRLPSPQWPDWREVAVIAAYSITVFVLGGLFFRHLKRGFADVL